MSEDKSDLYKIDQQTGIWTKKHDLVIPGSDGTDRTDNNVPYGSGLTLRIARHMQPIYEQKYKDNPDYYKENNIQEVIVMSTEEYMAMIRQNADNTPVDYSLVEKKTPIIQEQVEEIVDNGGLVDSRIFNIDPSLQNRKFNEDKFKDDLTSKWLMDEDGNKKIKLPKK